MDEIAIKGLHRVEVQDEKGGSISVTPELRTKRIHVLAPIGKQNRCPALDLTVIHANERGAPKGRKSIVWKLMTDLPARTRSEAIEKIWGTPCVGRSRSSTKFSNQDAAQRSPN